MICLNIECKHDNLCFIYGFLILALFFFFSEFVCESVVLGEILIERSILFFSEKKKKNARHCRLFSRLISAHTENVRKFIISMVSPYEPQCK